MSEEKQAERELKKAISDSFEIQAAEFKCTEKRFLGYKRFYGIYSPETHQLRFRAGDKVVEREVYYNMTDRNDDRKYMIRGILKNDVSDYVVKVRDKEYPVKCYFADIELF